MAAERLIREDVEQMGNDEAGNHHEGDHGIDLLVDQPELARPFLGQLGAGNNADGDEDSKKVDVMYYGYGYRYGEIEVRDHGEWL
jgi:hypothetical protein